MDVGKAVEDGITGAAVGAAGGPIGVAMGLVSGLAPDLITAFLPHLAGPQGGLIASSVVQTVASVIGAANPTPGAVTGLTAEARADVQAKLATLVVQAEQAKQVGIATITTDVQSARSQTKTLLQAHSLLAYGAATISIVVLLAFGLVSWLVMFRAVPPGSEQLMQGVLEALKLMSVTVVGYWCGSSMGSVTKDATLASAQTALANSTPVK